MHPVLTPALAGLLFGAASALPGAGITPVLLPRANPTDAWVSVDTTGKGRTITPSISTVTDPASTYTTIISGAPYDVTGTVFTSTYMAVETTSTSSAMATATDASGAGAYAVCHNPDGEYAPFCAPADNSTLYPGKTYYVTWDSTYFKASNTTVQVHAYYLNSTTGEKTETESFASDSFSAGSRSYYTWTIDSSMPSIFGGQIGVNATLEIGYSTSTSGTANTTWVTGPRVLISTVPTYRRPNSSAPTGKALYIGLPTIAGFVILMVVGTLLWNRKVRKIGLGNVMSRRRGGGYASGKSRSQRLGLGRRKKAEGIRLMEREEGIGEQRYQDVPDEGEFGGRWDPHAGSGGVHHGRRSSGDLPSIDIPRRDSDALGSLVGTPTEERRMDFPRPSRGNAGGNVFRDEMDRQDRERL